MKNHLNKSLIERFSRQIIIKNIGTFGQKKILSSKVLIVGVGGLGSPVAEFLSRAGVGTIGIVDNDKVSLSNLHRQSLYLTRDIGKPKVKIAKDKIKKINNNTIIKTYKFRLNNLNFKKIIKEYDYIVDGSDNFATKFLINDLCLKFKKTLITGAISKFDGHIFTFNFKNKKIPCLKCFFQESEISDDLLNCDSEGILGTVASIVGTIQANEVLKTILGIKDDLNNNILIFDSLKTKLRKIKIISNPTCLNKCKK